MTEFHAAIQTTRFRLAPLTVDDVTHRYLSWFMDPTVRANISSAKAMNALGQLRRYISERANRYDVVFLGIFDKHTSLHVGNIKFEPIDIRHCFAVMGILIGEADYRGKGVTAEVLGACGHWLQQHRGLTHLILTVHPDHTHAICAYRAAGFALGCPDTFVPVPGVVTMVKWL